MEVKLATGALPQSNADTLIVYAFEDSSYDQPQSNARSALNQALDDALHDLINGGDFSGKVGEIAVVYTGGKVPARRVILVGLGGVETFTADGARRAAAQGILKARDLKARVVATLPLGTSRGGLDVATSAQAVTEGALLGLYRYRGQRTSEPPQDSLETLLVTIRDEGDNAAAQRGIEAGTAIAGGTMLARDLVNTPPNFCTPSYLAQAAQEIAQTHGLKIEVLEDRQMRALNMGALLAVAQGSDTPPRFIILEHNADQVGKVDTVVLIGKGVTFDTGGYSIKTFEGMGTMKADMAGAAAVIGAMQAAAALQVPLHVVGIVPSADNMIGSHAYRPQEVITASNGTTIEIVSTDAEGRLLLADALVYAARYQPEAVVDIATLTGACVVALGTAAAGFFCTDERLRSALLGASKATNEKIWELPLFPEYEKSIESQVADIKNSGGRTSGVGSSATFLKHFVNFPSWAHIDMAGVMLDAEENPYVPGKGATGYGVRLLTEFVRQWLHQSL
jgi:leucyl aminopeptidase